MTHEFDSTVDPSAGQAASIDALTFLHWLYGDEAPGWLTICTFDPPTTRWFPAHQLGKVAKSAQTVAQRANCYFGLGLRQAHLKSGRGESTDVLGIPGLWCELDIKHQVHNRVNLPETIDQALALVHEAFPLHPSVVIDSGYGIHVHWLFRELWIFEDDNERQAAYHLLHRLQLTIQTVAKLHSWDVDSTFDLARVLRIPGTYNRKVPDDLRLVTILKADPERRYNSSDFDEYLIEVDEPTDQQATSQAYAGELLPIELHTLKIPTWLKTLIKFGEDVKAAKPYPSRSEALFDAVQGLIKAGIDEPTIMSLALDSRYAISEKPREKGRAWLASEIARARAKLNGHQPQRDTLLNREDSRPKAEAPDCTLPQLTELFQRWLYMPDLGPLYTYLGTIAANRMRGDPVWLMLIGGPGWGKTETLLSGAKLPHMHIAATLTEASLLSGTRKKERSPDAKGGLLRQIGEFGFLVLKDFTSILSMNRDIRTGLLAALREIYDGKWTRHVGVDGGLSLDWTGKLAVIGGCTGTIDGYHSVIGAMGERFIFYRWPHISEREQARRALQLLGKEAQMRDELSAAVQAFFAGLVLPETPPALTEAEQEWLIALASLVVRARSAVERDSHTRDIQLIPDAEAPSRLTLTLARLYGGLRAIGVTKAEAWWLVVKIGFDCLPALRWRVLEYLLKGSASTETPLIATELGYPTQTTRRTLEDLAAHGIISRKKGTKADDWSIPESVQVLYKAATGQG